LLDARARQVNDAMKIEAARAIASIVSASELSDEYIIPSVFDKRVVEAVADGSRGRRPHTGVARRKRRVPTPPSGRP
jgi:malate dehydrogenase (oxaloacetate-decarboxylating)